MNPILLALLLYSNIALADDNPTSGVTALAVYKAFESYSLPSIWHIEPLRNMTFVDKNNKTIGTLDFSDGQLKFTGNADESAKVFIRYLRDYTDELNGVCIH